MRKKLSKRHLLLLSFLVAPFLIWGVFSFGATSVSLNFSIQSSGGTVTGTGVSCPSDCSQSFTYGTASTYYTAHPKAGFKFKGWDTDADGSPEYTTQTLRVNHSRTWNIKALFQRYSRFIVEPSNRAGGYVSGTQINCPTDCYVYYAPSTSKYTYRAYPASGYRFRGWDVGNNGSIDNTSVTYSIPLNQSLTVKAVFTRPGLPTCALTASPSTIKKGTSATLWWSAANATRVAATWTSATALSGSKVVKPSATTTYKLTAYNYEGSGVCYRKVTVTVPTTTPRSSGGTQSSKKTAVTRKPTSNAATPADSEPPTVPSNLKAVYQDDTSGVYLTWSAASDNRGISGYEIGRRERGTGSWAKVTDSVFGTNYLDTNVASEKQYEYRIRAYDAKNNYSDWSQAAPASTGPFEANATITEGGEIQTEEGEVIVSIPKEALNDDIFVSIVPVELIQLNTNGKRTLGEIYEIKAKDRYGQEVKEFLAPIKITFLLNTADIKSLNLKSLKIARSEDNTSTTEVGGSYDKTSSSISVDVDHLTPYYVVASEKNPFWAFLRNLSLGLLILAIIAAPFAYFYWHRYKSQRDYEAVQNDLKY